jgi:hypothetical protein
MDYISREKATEALIRHRMHISDTWQTDYRGEVAGIDMAVCIIEDLPAADVPEHNVGKWLPIIDADEYGEPYQSGVYCSECGEMLCYVPHYCPNCGAKMEG